MNEQVDNALGGHGFATVTSTPLYTRDELVEHMWWAANTEAKVTGKKTTAKKWQMQAIINALLATGQLKVKG